MNRAECLKKAHECVCGQREQDYGKPEDNFKGIAGLWSAYKGVEFTAGDVAMMMALLKVARIRTGTGTADSFVDLAGYAACAAEIASTEYITTPYAACAAETASTEYITDAPFGGGK